MQSDRSFAQALEFAILSIDYRVLADAEPWNADGCLILAENRRAVAQGYLDLWLEGGATPDQQGMLDLNDRIGGAATPAGLDAVFEPPRHGQVSPTIRPTPR